MAEREEGVVLKWCLKEGRNGGYGFIERSDGSQIFCHRNAIRRGDALQEHTLVSFRTVPNPSKGRHCLQAADVEGGVCFAFLHATCPRQSGCPFSHTPPPPPPAPPPLDELVASIHASRGHSPPLFVDTLSECEAQCARLAREGEVAVDFEGVDLGRGGELLLAQLASPTPPAVILDIAKLQAAAFEEGGLRALLESPRVLKLVYDGRADADALYHLYGVRLLNVCDCQILFTLHLDGFGRTTHLPGLGRALAARGDAGSRELTQLKSAVGRLFIPDKGGSYEVWRERPLRAALLEYAACDVCALHDFKRLWGGLIDAAEMRRLAERRIRTTIEGDGAKGQHMSERDF
ncbi:hypothetical protein AB1Y20_012838 [Prymnesium parvum]|uniref:C3H1-type domain-containing protein n=1 Tax=Prymnesium parvum TaxID=97485 RepID=A0AB34IJ03_PRYPA